MMTTVPNPHAKSITTMIHPSCWMGSNRDKTSGRKQMELRIMSSRTTRPFERMGSALALDECPEDLDGDGFVGITDFLQLLAEWGMVGVPADFDGGGVGINDFLQLLAAWGRG